jgi:hypothetical protein
MARIEDVRGEAGRDGREPGEREQARTLDTDGSGSGHDEERGRGGE